MIKAEVILLDIEGTTTPVDYVYGVLFPFAKLHLSAFLAQNINNSEVQIDLELLRQEYIQESISECIQEIGLPNWEHDPVPYIHFLIDRDRKSKGLKSLQGKIWQQGYESGELRSQIFTDVLIALQTWQKLGKQIYIYSSGSVNAQKLLFQYSEIGDLTKYLSGYFDTAIGAKQESSSYAKIVEQIEMIPSQILFISDVVAELQAASKVGMQTVFSIRPGNNSFDSQGFNSITSFSKIHFLGIL